ncbi:MAG TPA: group I intron-associated PD-(D/E)XK endonuclease [Ktedonobacteraceae bacterium]|nr:group I intron-associated PD-(D/E)XK endonuclease [Ktedonobacteraceae bacterium]
MQKLEPVRPKPNNHKAVGEQSEAIIIAKLVELGYNVLLPFGDNQRYDLIIEDAALNFHRIQCKTGWVESKGAYIEFKTASSYYHTRQGRTEHERKGYRGQVDYFAVYSPDTGKVYLVPMAHASTVNCFLRLVPTKNNQGKHVRWAKDYEL